MISQERQREITLHVFDEEINEASVADLSIEETIFLVKEIERFKENFPEEKYRKNHNQAVFQVIMKLRSAEKLYLVIDSATRYPFIIQECIQIYSTEEYAKKAVKRFEEQMKRHCAVLCVPKDHSPLPQQLNVFAYLHFIGAKKVVIEDGQTVSLVLLRDDILPAPDLSNLPEIQRPLVNGAVQYAMIQYFQEVRWPVQYATRKETVKKKEELMLNEILKAQYLMPMKRLAPEDIDGNGKIQLKGDSKIQIAVMKNQDGANFIPAFTDWPEFEKIYDKNDWAANKVSFDILANFSENYDGFVINPGGENFLGNKQNIEQMRKMKEEKGL